MKKVNILGTLYKIYFDAPDEKLPEGCDGCMDQSIHQIRIAKLESSRNSLMNLKEYKKKVLTTGGRLWCWQDCHLDKYRAYSSVVEQWSFKPCVTGSIPVKSY